jgi:tetratricopeptide (TPR) repeat protein
MEQRVSSLRPRNQPHSQPTDLDRAVLRLQAEALRLTQRLRANPDDAEAYYLRGIVYGQLVEPLKAIDDFDAALRLGHETADTYYNRGMALVHTQQHYLAVEDFTDAIRLQPGHADAWNNRAAAYWDLAQPELTLRDADEAARLDPNRASPHTLRALALTQLGQTAEANAAAGRATALGFDANALEYLIRQAQQRAG